MKVFRKKIHAEIFGVKYVYGIRRRKYGKILLNLSDENMGINCTILSTFCTFENFHHIKKKQKKEKKNTPQCLLDKKKRHF